ncbi:MAG: serine/threonine-protein kinase [Myxococcota bacterium]|nr:serine/threonine-protein kinase [Myxococcota bacterium]
MTDQFGQGRLIVGAAFGDYVLEKRLGSGGMAEIFLARRSGSEGFQRQVVIKRIHPHLSENKEFRAMFVDEAKLCAQLHHPNIVSIYDFDTYNGSYYMVMEVVDGVDLTSLILWAIDQERVLRTNEIAFIGSQVGSALSYTHNAQASDGTPLNIVHRDITPSNIMVSRFGEVKVMDFGIAKAAARMAKTQTGTLKGKFSYMAPEQIEHSVVSKYTDQFALGCVLWELLTLQKLFSGCNEADVLMKVIKGDVPKPSEYASVEKGMEDIVMRALARKPTSRYADIGEMADDLSRVVLASERAIELKCLVDQIIKETPEEEEEDPQLQSPKTNLNYSGNSSPSHRMRKQPNDFSDSSHPFDLEQDERPVLSMEAYPDGKVTREMPLVSSDSSHPFDLEQDERPVLSMEAYPDGKVTGEMSLASDTDLSVLEKDRVMKVSKVGKPTEASVTSMRGLAKESSSGEVGQFPVKRARGSALVPNERRTRKEEWATFAVVGVIFVGGMFFATQNNSSKTTMEGNSINAVETPDMAIQGVEPETSTALSGTKVDVSGSVDSARRRGSSSHRQGDGEVTNEGEAMAPTLSGGDTSENVRKPSRIESAVKKKKAVTPAKAPSPTVAAPAKAKAPSPTVAAPAKAPVVAPPGTLSLRKVGPWVAVYLKGEKLGHTPLRNVEVPSGKQIFQLVNKAAGIDELLELEIKPGELTQYIVR